MIPNSIATYYDPATGHVTMTCGIGSLTCVSSVPLDVYERRVAAFPGLYPEELLSKKSCQSCGKCG